MSKNGGSAWQYVGKAHAVTYDGAQSYVYDGNGSMTQRGTGQYLKYDAENRLVKVSSDVGGSTYIARFAYDGDGKRVKRVDNYGTIHYAGPHYERNVGTGRDTNETITKFYYAEMGKMKRLLALRKGTTLYYVCTDHLGGTARTTDVSGNNIDDIRYHAFGATRSGGTNTPTDKRYAGQTLDSYINLYHMGARSYDPVLGRFISPHSIMPDCANPQTLNTIRWNDPLGNYFIQSFDNLVYFFLRRCAYYFADSVYGKGPNLAYFDPRSLGQIAVC